MPRPKGHIAVIAAKYGITPKWVRDIIKKHPNLGITLKSREATILDRNQQTALCAVIEQEMSKYDAPPIEIIENYNETEMVPSSGVNETKNENEIEQLKAEIETLKSELSEVKTDLEVAKARAEERAERINDLKEAAGQNQKLLQAAQEERDEAQAEADSFRKSVFGFYRKK